MADKFEEVEKLYQAEKYEDAIDLLEDMMNEDEAYRDSFFLNGETLNEQSLHALYLKGKIYCECGQADTAEESLSEIPETNSNYYNACILRARMYYDELDNYAEAMELYNRIPESFPLYHEAQSEVALVYCAQGDYEKALKLLNASLADNDMYGNIIHSIAHVYDKMGDKARQMEYYDKVPVCDPSYGLVQISKATLLQENGDLEGALSCLATIPQENAYFFEGLQNSSTILMENNRVEEALELWTKVPADSKYYNTALYCRATIYNESGNPQAALDKLDKIPQLASGYLSVFELKAQIYASGELKDEKMQQQYNRWYRILEENWCIEGRLNSCIFSESTPEQQLEFWDSITPSSPEYYYAVLKKALIYKKELTDFATARRLLASIPEEGRKWLEDEYRFDFKKIELFEKEEEY